MSAVSFFQTPPPDVAVEIAPNRVVALAVTTDRGGAARVAAHAVEALPPGAVVPALNASNIARPGDVAQAISRAFATLGYRPRRVALVVPDAVAKVSFVRFANVPARSADLDELVKFQVRKAAPFRIEDAKVSYAPGLVAADGLEFVVTQARLDVIGEYEQACADAGAHAGVVGLATFNVVNAVLAASANPAGDWLLIHAQGDTATLAILRGAHMVFFRHRAGDGDGHLADLVHQTAMYYQDRLSGAGFARVLVAGALADDHRGETTRALEARLGVGVDTIDPTARVPLADRVAPSRDLIDALTPALGLALACRA
jgi:Tfp pilus assembly PilM family ATPase